MPSPFPGMDPWLENPNLWSGFHQRLAVYIADQLQEKIGPRYIASVEDRVYVQSAFHSRTIKPDVWVRDDPRKARPSTTGTALADEPQIVTVTGEEMHETYVDLLDKQTGMAIVTTIEVLSLTNKHPGKGKKEYLKKQREVLASNTHLVEIDLLRGGQHRAAVPLESAREHGPYDLLVCVNRAQDRQQFELYRRTLRESLPRCRVPLASGDEDTVLDLAQAFARTYDMGVYEERIRYEHPCTPPLTLEDAAWAKERLRAAGISPTPIART